MSRQPRETFQSPLAAAKHQTSRASDDTKRNISRRKAASSPSEGDDTSPGVFDGTSAASLGRPDETTHTHPSAKDKRETTVPVLKEDEAVSSTSSVRVDSAKPLSQKEKTVERAHSSAEDIQTAPLREGEAAVDSQPPDKDNRATSSQAVVTAHPSGSSEDESACEHRASCVARCWR